MQCCCYTYRYRREECGVLKEPRCTCPPYRLPPRCKEQHQKELLEQGKFTTTPNSERRNMIWLS